jgi:fatty acid desaturase
MRNKKNIGYLRPDIAYPTLGLFFTATTLHLVMVLLGNGFILPISAFDYNYEYLLLYHIASTFLGILCIIFSTISCYTQFTVAHDAIHRSISRKYPFFNDIIGFTAQIWLGPTSSWTALKHNHLMHHAHTNNAEFDPDHWCSLKGPGGKWLTPLRWMFVDISYIHFYVFYLIRRRSWWIRIKNISYDIVKLCIIFTLYRWGYFPLLLLYWILPSRIALFILAYAFDFLPHYPHETTIKENKYKTTAYIYTPWIFRWLLSILIFSQNYHIAHHLVPQVPFYRYKNVWYLLHKDLLEEGIIQRHILPKLLEEKIVKIFGDDEYDLLLTKKN